MQSLFCVHWLCYGCGLCVLLPMYVVCVLLWLVCCSACAMATYACAMPVCNGYLCRGECAKWIYDPFNTIRPLEHYWVLPVGDNHLKKDKKVSSLDSYQKKSRTYLSSQSAETFHHMFVPQLHTGSRPRRKIDNQSGRAKKGGAWLGQVESKLWSEEWRGREGERASCWEERAQRGRRRGNWFGGFADRLRADSGWEEGGWKEGGGGGGGVTQGDPVFRFCLLPIKATT